MYKSYDSVSNNKNYWPKKEIISDTSSSQRPKTAKRSKIPTPTAVKDMGGHRSSTFAKNQRERNHKITYGGKVITGKVRI